MAAFAAQLRGPASIKFVPIKDGDNVIGYSPEVHVALVVPGLGGDPFEVSVTTLLDGRQVARSVYRDLRERKIKNYETL